nr:hypothetical protein CFP56_04878 [Quercus suber]POE92669.1 hypothetical protein CFP56_55824 [Quercus suber]
MGSPWIADASTAKSPKMVHRLREESGVVGNHMHEATNLVDNNPTREVVGIGPSTPRTEVLLENGKVQKLVAKVGETEATLGVFGGEQTIDQGDSIKGMQWEIATYQDLEEVLE